MSNYSELLKHPKWQKMRLKILERDKFTCQKCEETEKTLHIHHRIYFRKSKPWEYDKSYLVTLCENCHKEEFESLDRESAMISHAFKYIFFSNEIEMIWKSMRDSKIKKKSIILCAFICAFFTNNKFQNKILKEFKRFYDKGNK